MTKFSLPLEAIRSTRIVTAEGIRPGVIRIARGCIASIEPYDSPLSGPGVWDAGEDAVLPGLVDTHVHLNEPGRTEWEGFETGTRAAAAGGYTTIVEMPLNSIPSTTTVEALALKRDRAEGKCVVDYAFWGGVVNSDAAAVMALADAGVPGFKCFLIHPGTDEFQMVTEKDLRAVMPGIARRGLPLLVHAELAEPIERATAALIEEQADWRTYACYLQSRPPQAEVDAIEMMISLSREYGCRVHIVHLSAAEALGALARAREDGVPITVETCPHYLFFSSEQLIDGATAWKCAPPIRNAANQERLWQALASGVIDMVASDHSPCPPSLKLPQSGHFARAWGGISSLSLSLPIMWTEAQARGFGLEHLVQWLSTEPARLAGLHDRKGAIRANMDADLVVFDTAEEWEVAESDLYFRHPVSPYLGARLRGRVKATVLRGEVCFERGLFSGRNRGRELRHGQASSHPPRNPARLSPLQT